MKKRAPAPAAAPATTLCHDGYDFADPNGSDKVDLFEDLMLALLVPLRLLVLVLLSFFIVLEEDDDEEE